MATSVDDRRTHRLLKNHGELKATLKSLSMEADLPRLESHVRAAASQWFRLAGEHCADAAEADPAAHPVRRRL